MKRKSVIVLFLFLVGCTAMPIADPVCPQEDSWICEKSAELNVAPETVYGWIYSAAAVAAVSKITDIKEICDFEQEIADFYVRVYPVTYDTLIDEAILTADFKNPETALLIKNILNRNLIMYKSPKFISDVDNAILRRGHVAFRRDMLCYD